MLAPNSNPKLKAQKALPLIRELALSLIPEHAHLLQATDILFLPVPVHPPVHPTNSADRIQQHSGVSRGCEGVQEISDEVQAQLYGDETVGREEQA
jgi:hypothetical protein